MSTVLFTPVVFNQALEASCAAKDEALEQLRVGIEVLENNIVQERGTSAELAQQLEALRAEADAHATASTETVAEIEEKDTIIEELMQDNSTLGEAIAEKNATIEQLETKMEAFSATEADRGQEAQSMQV